MYNELNTAPGWDTFENVNYLNADYQDLNDSFTEPEKNKTRLCINEVKERVKTLDLSKEALQIIQEILDKVSDKVDVLSKFDWKSFIYRNNSKFNHDARYSFNRKWPFLVVY